ncbi:MAG TPA: TVP38/TMEM64 family protein [Gemmatimonadales bacterium]|nr:TVP38/TMEM64 family protein [Gemmatimonadales bacterium]
MPAPDRKEQALKLSPRGGIKLLLFILVLVAGVIVVRASPAHQYFTAQGITTLVSQLRREPWAPFAFVAAYTVATAFDFSGAVLTLLGGAIFGFWWGSVLNLLGANLGASGAFWLARGLGREGLTSLTGGGFGALDQFSAERGFAWLLRLRLIPIVPFNLLNFAAGLTAMSWRTFALATAIGVVPATLVYTYFADALLVAGKPHVEAQRVIVRVSVALAALVALSFVPSLFARRRGSTAVTESSERR